MLRSKSFGRFRVPPAQARRAASTIGMELEPPLDPSLPDISGIAQGRSVGRARRLARQSSIGEAAESLQETVAVTTFLTKLTAKLMYFAAGSAMAWVMFLRLVAYAAILLPGFLRIVYRYFTSTNVFREFYGGKRRQSLDIYVDSSTDSPYGRGSKRPVIIFLSGGAWIIGYKAWGAFMGFCYSRLGFVFVAPDYRNFPQAEIDEMICDVDLAIGWVKRNIKHYDGSDHIVLMGQSAGAHLGSMALLSAIQRKAERSQANNQSSFASLPEEEKDYVEGSTLWEQEDLSGFIGISGPYNIARIAPYLQGRGLNPALLNRLFKRQFKEFSPVYYAKRLTSCFQTRTVESSVPIALFHGTNDVTVPHEISQEFYRTLRHCLEHESSISLTLMENLSHTDPIIELPMSGQDPLLAKVVVELNKMVHTSVEPPEMAEQLLPFVMIKLARFVNPF